MVAALKRRYASGSSSSESACAWAAPRPRCPLPNRRVRKVARTATSHLVAVIAPGLQQHRGKDASFSSGSDTEVSSSDTELGTALSEVESAIPESKSSEKDASDAEMLLSSPERESDEVDENLGDARMSSSPSPPQVGRYWAEEKMLWSPPRRLWGDEKGKGKQVEEVQDMGDVKRRRISDEEEDAEADDEMEETESVIATPKQKQKMTKNRKGPGLSEKHSTRKVAPTPSIQRITDGFNGLTPYSREMQISPDHPSFTLQAYPTSTSLFDDDEDEHAAVFDSLIPSSPSPGPSKKRILTRPSTVRQLRDHSRRIPGGKKKSHRIAPVVSAESAEKQQRRDRQKPYAPDPFLADSMSILRSFEHFNLPIPSEEVEATEQSSNWAYGPLSSPIRLVSEPPRSPIRSRISVEILPGQRTRPNKNLQRRSPTSLVPSRHHKGRLHRSRPAPQSRRPLPLCGPNALVGQHVITYFHLLKDARTKRRHAVSRQNALVNFTALAAMRARCFEHFERVDAWKNLLADIGQGCWWWPAPAQRDVAQVVEEVQVDCLVGGVAVESEGDAAVVDALVTSVAPPSPVREAVTAAAPSRRRQRSDSPVEQAPAVRSRQRARLATPEERERARRAEAAQLRVSVTTSTIAAGSVIPTSSAANRDEDAVSAEVDAHRDRTASRTSARRVQEAAWALSSDRAAAQRRRLGRTTAPLDAAPIAAVRHVSELNPAWLQASRPSAPVEVEINVAEPEEDEATDTESESGSTVSDPPAYDSATYPRHIPCPPHVRPRLPPTPVHRLPSYATNRYSRRSPSPPPPYNAETDRQTLILPMFIGEDDDDEDENAVAGVAVSAASEQRVVGAFPSSIGDGWGQDEGRRNRFDAALEMEEGADADLIDELTGGFEGEREREGSVVGAIGGFFRGFFGRR